MKLDKYFSPTNQAPVYLGEVVFNPKFKWRYFEVKWNRNWVRNGKQRLKRYWLQYLAIHVKKNHNNFDSVEPDHGQLHSSELPL